MFIGREKELNELTQLYNTEQFQMPIIYGRRRVGKSTLIRKFTEDKLTITFTAIESSAEKNLELFSKSIYKALVPDMPGLPAFSSFEAAFDFITDHAKKQRIIVVIDEYPYLAAASKMISSLLQTYIDNQWSSSKLYLILCGSSLSFMENQVLGYQSPLYGRRTAQLKILPFDYITSSLFVPDYSLEEKAIVYGVTGGIPKYLELLNPSISLYDNITNLFFKDSGYLYEEPNNLLKQELRDVSTYNAVMEALASGATKINELVTKTHTDTATISYCLKTLISIGIVQKDVALTDENNKKKTHYTICDNMFRFWYRFVPNGNELILMQQGHIYFEEMVKPYLADYMGLIFEEMCRFHLMKMSLNNTTDFRIMKMGRWWGTNPALKREEEIDLIGINPISKCALIGECKYRNSGIHLETAENLLKRGELITGYPTKQYVLCSKNHFTDSVLKFAKEHNILLITLEDMF